MDTPGRDPGPVTYTNETSPGAKGPTRWSLPALIAAALGIGALVPLSEGYIWAMERAAAPLAAASVLAAVLVMVLAPQHRRTRATILAVATAAVIGLGERLVPEHSAWHVLFCVVAFTAAAAVFRWTSHR